VTCEVRVFARSLVGICLLIFSLSSFAATDIDFTLEQGGAISGQVTEAGAPPGFGLSNFLVYALDATTGDLAGSATTDFLGNYRIDGLPAGNHIVYVNSGFGLSLLSGGQLKRFAGAYFPGTYDRTMAGQVTVTAGATQTANVSLGGGGSVTGTVTRDDNDAPIDAVPVYLTSHMTSETDFLSQVTLFFGVTGSNGAFTIEGVPPGDYVARTGQVSSLANEFYGDTYQRNLATKVTVTDGMATANIDFDLAEGGSISGTVTRQSDGQPMNGVDVFAQAVNPEASLLIAGADATDSNGDYLLQGLPPGSFYVGVNFAFSSMQQYASEYYPGAYRLADALAQNMTSGLSKSNIDFSVEMGGTISGVVRRGDNLQPMEGVTVAVAPASDLIADDIVGALSHFPHTDENGQYAIEGLPPGPYYVGATPESGLGMTSPAAIYAGYFAPQLYDGVYDLGSAGMVTASLNAEVSDIDFDLEIGGVISGRVTRADNGQPIAGVSVIAGVEFDLNAGGGDLLYFVLFDREGGTDSNGDYQIVGAPPGNAIVAAFDDNDVFVTEVYDNKTGLDMATPVAVTLNGIATSTLSGTLVANNGGDPAAGLLVEAFEASTMQLAGSTTSAANGSYSIPGLFPGNYQVKVNGDETYRTEFYDNAELLADAATVLVALGSDVTGIDFGLALVNGGNIDQLITTMMLLLLED
jgi:protocatechuate 3,4-dioxygenase beta subunit